MGRAQYLLKRDVRKEEADIQKKYKKRGLWSKIGMGLGGALAMGLTGGAAAPAVAALMAGGGTFLGGKLGDIAAKKGWFGSGKAEIAGKGRFLSGQREGVVSQIGEDILAGSVKAGLGAGMTALGAGLKLGKGGLTATMPGGAGVEVGKGGVASTKGGFKFGDIFKARGGGPVEAYGEGLMGKLGKAIDIKGSTIGEYAGSKLHPGGWTGMELTKAGEESLGTRPTLFREGEYGATADSPQVRRHAEFAPGEITSKIEGAETAARIEKGGFLQFDDPEQYARRAAGGADQISPADFRRPPDLPGIEKVSVDTPMYKTGGETGYTSEIPLGKGLSADEQLLRTDIEKSMDWRAAGRPGLEDSIVPSEFRGGPSADLPSLPGRGDYADPTELIPGSGRTPTSYGGGMDETRMTTEDWKSAIPSDAGTINPSELRRSPAAQFTPEKIDVPEMKPMYNKQVLKKDLEDTFSIGTTTYRSDLSPYGLEGGGYTAPERFDTPDWWNRLMGGDNYGK